MRIGDRTTIEDVLWHYREIPRARVGENELATFTITPTEFLQLEAFLRTLEGPIDAPARYLHPPEAAPGN
jgi:hypothetical protein